MLKVGSLDNLYPMMDNYPQTALITGASSGLGAEFAHQLAARGYELVLVARREERLKALATEIKNKSDISAEVLIADLSDQSGVDYAVNAIKQISNLALLINNAGFGLSGEFSQLELDRQLEMIRLHVIASVSLTHAALPGMLARKSGAIINVSSLAGLIPLRNVTYGSTKAYLVQFSRALHNELAGKGIRIQALCPGYIRTEFHEAKGISRERRSQIPKFLWVSAEKIVNESLASLERGNVICVPGMMYRLIAILGTNSMTYPLLRTIVKKVIRT